MNQKVPTGLKAAVVDVVMADTMNKLASRIRGNLQTYMTSDECNRVIVDWMKQQLRTSLKSATLEDILGEKTAKRVVRQIAIRSIDRKLQGTLTKGRK